MAATLLAIDNRVYKLKPVKSTWHLVLVSPVSYPIPEDDYYFRDYNTYHAAPPDREAYPKWYMVEMYTNQGYRVVSHI